MKDIILLDLDNTLLDFNMGAYSSMKNGFIKYGLDFSDDMFTVFTGTNNYLWKSLEKGEITREQLRDRRWSLIFSKLGLEADSHSFEIDFENGIADSAYPVSGAIELLKYLAPKYDIYIVTNGFTSTQKGRLKKAGMDGFIKGMFVSDAVGASKPDRAFFDFCFETLGNPDKKRVTLIGDSLSADIKGAKDYGIKSVWFSVTDETPGEAVKPDYTVKTLKEIEAVL